MHIKVKKSWELPESAVTPEADYLNRRKFIRAAGMGVAGMAFLKGQVLGAATEGFPSKLNPDFKGEDLEKTPEELVTSYNNFYEFTTSKEGVKRLANLAFKSEPWTVEIDGLCANKGKHDVNGLVKKMGGIEQRVYRFRCVEAWSMVVPWDGFPLKKLVDFAQPDAKAKYIKFTTFYDPKVAPGQKVNAYSWPYTEGLRLDEATNELPMMVTGLYGKPLPNQNGAPIRLIVPWKYGFKSIKSIVKIEFVEKQPASTWMNLAPSEYGFYANVNPDVSHPRWSQATERVIGGGFFSSRQKTLKFNGYADQVAPLYKGMDLKKNY